MKKILIADDEEQLRTLVKIYLVPEGYQVDEAVNGREALQKIKHEKYDLLVLDVMMPEVDGWQVCRQIRQEQRKISILMLTAKSQVEDKLEGFALGADDYMGKPFDPRELAARIQALLRRGTEHQGVDLIVLDELKIDKTAHTVRVKRQEVFLTVKEFNLLTLMAENQGRVFSREQLLELIWGQDFLGGTRTVDSHVKNIRVKLQKCGLPDVIHTVWGIGYKFESKSG